MTDAYLVLRKVSLMRDHIARVRRRRPQSLEDFRRDVDLQDAIALSLLVAIQEALDIALHIAADEGWGVPASYAEAFALLAKNGVIEAEHGLKLGRAASLRNRIAHGYAALDLDRLWKEIPVGLDALDQLAEAVARLVGADS